ncbi:MAG: AAA family ATPase [Dehalococcoidales bacterium]|nr:AAA family ATPase [Dehalococcoidales bacterium]
MNVVAIVGMAGSGKSEVARFFSEQGFSVVRFGDITDETLRSRGLALTEENERAVREELRRRYGMAAYAELSLPRIDGALGKNGKVVVDGLYSWEEYLFLRERYGDRFAVVAVWAPPSVRYRRLGSRKVRPLTPAEAFSRDRAEIENLNKGGPIAMADFTVLNDASLTELREQLAKVMERLNGHDAAP